MSERIVGTVIWFKKTYGFIGHGLYTNNKYENQTYAHYKNVDELSMINEKYRELFSGDICEFEIGKGFHTETPDGTQALNISVLEHVNKDK